MKNTHEKIGDLSLSDVRATKAQFDRGMLDGLRGKAPAYIAVRDAGVLHYERRTVEGRYAKFAPTSAGTEHAAEYVRGFAHGAERQARGKGL